MRPRKEAMMPTLLRLLIPAVSRLDARYPEVPQARSALRLSVERAGHVRVQAAELVSV